VKLKGVLLFLGGEEVRVGSGGGSRVGSGDDLDVLPFWKRERKGRKVSLAPRD